MIACERGALKFWLRSGTVSRRCAVPSRAACRACRCTARSIVDHGLCVPSAELVFVHNLATEAQPASSSALTAAPQVAAEREFFRALIPTARSSRIRSWWPRFASTSVWRANASSCIAPEPVGRRFSPQRQPSCAAARRDLGLDAATPLVGFVTSGDFAKRGLDLFLDCAARIARRGPMSGSSSSARKSLPADARAACARRATASCSTGRRAVAPRALVRGARSVPLPRALRGIRHGGRRRRRRWACPS